MSGLTLDAGAHRIRVQRPAPGVRGASDVIDASVVLCAKARGHQIATSDQEDIRRLDPAARVIRV